MSDATTTGPESPPHEAPARGRRKVATGRVTRDKMDKTRRVEVDRLVPHPKYGKYLKRRTICYVHDEGNETRVGDLVEIMETRPLSRTKRWRLVRIVRKAPSHEEADARAAAEARSSPPADEATEAGGVGGGTPMGDDGGHDPASED